MKPIVCILLCALSVSNAAGAGDLPPDERIQGTAVSEFTPRLKASPGQTITAVFVDEEANRSKIRWRRRVTAESDGAVYMAFSKMEATWSVRESELDLNLDLGRTRFSVPFEIRADNSHELKGDLTSEMSHTIYRTLERGKGMGFITCVESGCLVLESKLIHVEKSLSLFVIVGTPEGALNVLKGRYPEMKHDRYLSNECSLMISVEEIRREGGEAHTATPASSKTQ